VISNERISVNRGARDVVESVAAGLSVASIVILQVEEGCRSIWVLWLAYRGELLSKATRETIGQQREG
jgi:hypothetical protein